MSLDCIPYLVNKKLNLINFPLPILITLFHSIHEGNSDLWSRIYSTVIKFFLSPSYNFLHSDHSICMEGIQTDGNKTWYHYDVHSLYGWSETVTTFRLVQDQCCNCCFLTMHVIWNVKIKFKSKGFTDLHLWLVNSHYVACSPYYV